MKIDEAFGLGREVGEVGESRMNTRRGRSLGRVGLNSGICAAKHAGECDSTEAQAGVTEELAAGLEKLMIE
jgi:hypothetical protein